MHLASLHYVRRWVKMATEIFKFEMSIYVTWRTQYQIQRHPAVHLRSKSWSTKTLRSETVNAKDGVGNADGCPLLS